jgi:flagellar motor component MotA
MTKFYPVSLIVFLAVMAGAIVTSGGSVLLVLNWPSFLMVVVTAVILALGNFRLSEMGRYFRLGARREPVSRREAMDAISFFDALTRYIIIAGILGTLTGTIVMLANLGDVTRLGSGAALALITILYALIIHIGVVVPFRTGARRKLAELEE